MKWKENVRIVRNGDLQFQMGNKIKTIEKSDEYIALAVENGINDDKELIALVVKRENISETAAAFSFTQFILDYGAFIEVDRSHYVITE